ncbi:hypothetical protein P8610_12870 [Fictibacillus sp. UD]|uniref:hypothetical protein n=1 Tax=Fictibacillus sp. UD TaxID=3038777 RepID=UPI00374718AE
MTAIIGYLFEGGVFVAADTRRIFEVDRNKYRTEVSKKFEGIITRKIHKLTDNIAIAIAGNASEFGPLQELQWLITNDMDKDTIKSLITKVFQKYSSANTINQMLLFGMNDGNSFMVHIDEYLTMTEMSSKSIKGIPEESFELIAKHKSSGSAYMGILRLDIWAKISFNEIINNLLPELAVKLQGIQDPEMTKSSVAYPIDMALIRNDGKGFTWRGINNQENSEDVYDQFKIGVDMDLEDDDDKIFRI